MNDTTREQIYRRLADFLNTMPDGYPPSTTGADLRVLERLFTPEEAELAIHLTMERESAAVIARRAGVPARDAAACLAKMARRGLVFSVERAGQPPLYQAVPFVVGIYEFQVNDLTPELLKDLYEYALTRGPWPRVKSIPQLRTVPIGMTLDSHAEALPHERVGELVNAHNRFAVTHCICRKVAKMAGQGCDAPEETCLFFGDWADYYVSTGRGRAISREEVFAILRQANEANLVLQPATRRRQPSSAAVAGAVVGPRAVETARTASGRSGIILRRCVRPHPVRGMSQVPHALPNGSPAGRRRPHPATGSPVHRLRTLRRHMPFWRAHPRSPEDDA